MKHQIKQCNQEFQIQVIHKNGVEIIKNPLFKGFKDPIYKSPLILESLI